MLEKIVVEGGTKGTWDTKYDLGEIVIGSGMRADVLIYPTGNPGDIIPLVGNKLSAPFNISTALPVDYPIAYFEISADPAAGETAPQAGDSILDGTGEDIENIKAAAVTPLIDPVPAPFAPGSVDGADDPCPSAAGLPAAGR